MRDEIVLLSGSYVGEPPKGTLSRAAALAVGLSSIAGISLSIAPREAFASTVVRALAAPSQTSSGTWSLESDSRGTPVLKLTFEYGDSKDGSLFYISNTTATQSSSRWFSLQSVQLFLTRQYVSHVRRDSGTFNLLNFDGKRTAGSAVFVANQEFANRLRSNRIVLSKRDLLQLALCGATVEDVAILKATLPDIDAPTIGLVKMSGQSSKDILDLRQLLPTMTTTDLRVLLGTNVTPSYVLALQQAGLQHLAPMDVAKLKAAHIDAAFVQSKTTNSVVPTINELLQAKLPS